MHLCVISNILDSFCLQNRQDPSESNVNINSVEPFRLTTPLIGCYGYAVPIMASMGGVTRHHNERS